MAWQKRKEIPQCFACGQRPVDVRSVDEYEKTDESLCAVCKTLDNPYEKSDDCRFCTLFKRPGPVWTRGRHKSPLMFVGEAPGAEEAMKKWRIPFIGGSGRIHDRICQIAGTDSASHFTTNCVKCKPEHNRKPTDLEIRNCARYLLAEIEDCKPNVLVALGDTALYVLLGRVGITRHRGVPVEGFQGIKTIATLHPAYVMRDQSKFAMPVFDYVRAVEESAFPEVRRVAVEYNTSASPITDGPALLERVRKTKLFVEDLETTDLDPRTSQIICNGMSDCTPGRAESFLWSPEVAALTRTIHEDPTIEVITQNGEGFDLPYLEAKGVPIPAGKSFDTLVAFHLINPDLPKDLGTIGSFYTDMEYWKGDAKKNLFYYNCQDIDGTARAAIAMKKELKSLGMTDLYYKHVMPVQPTLRRMSRRGMKKDMLLTAKWIVALSNKADRMEQALRDGLGQPNLNVNSPKDMHKLLYETLGLPKQMKRTKTGYRPTADSDALDKLVELFPDHKILALAAEIRTIRSKYIATYLQAETDERDFVHARFGTSKAANGRLNSWDPNAQNIPFELREVYTADDEEHVWIEADWGQVEWRDAMVLAGDANGMKAMTSGYDPFKSAASFTLGKRIEDVTDDERHAQKFIIYGLGYGRSTKSIALAQGKDESWAIKFVGAYLAGFPDYRSWRDEQIKFVQKNYYLKNPWNRRRWWFTRMITEAYNFTPSSTAADMMYEVIPRVEAQLPKGATLRINVHDSLSVVAHRDVAKEAYTCLKENMQMTFPELTAASRRPEVVRQFFPNGWSCPADAHIGRNWAEAKKGNKALEKEILG